MADSVIDNIAREMAIEAKGIAREAVQVVESYTKVSEERWSNQRREWEEARRVLANISTKMDQQHAENKASAREQNDNLRAELRDTKAQVKELQVSFEIGKKESDDRIDAVDGRYNGRFWAMASAVILTLVSLCGVLLAHQFLK